MFLTGRIRYSLTQENTACFVVTNLSCEFRGTLNAAWRFDVPGIGKSLIVIGLIIALVGVVITLAGRLPWLGRLPGDIYVKRENFTFYFPLATSILVSLLLSFILWLLRR